jgi:Tat protein secretion system quality control protein TatD with DNase activity
MDFVFQTLSLFDVWSTWPHLAPMKAAIERGKPLDFHDHVIAVLKILNPVLAARLQDPDDPIVHQFKSEHVDLLLNYYEREHDWSRIATLVSKTTEAGAIEAGTDPNEAHQTFVNICSAAARHCGMDMLEFIKQRFEFCADQFILLHHLSLKAREEAEDSRAENWRDVTSKLAATFGVKPTPVPEAQQPEWMRALNKVRVN